MKVGKIVEFDSAHWLPGHAQCGNLHGHRFRLEVEVEGPMEHGMVIDFPDLKKGIEFSTEGFDHGCLNDIVEFPTAENLILRVLWRISSYLEVSHPKIKVTRLKLWETPTNYALWEQENNGSKKEQ